MRCIDTPLLEDLLLGRTRSKKWLSTLGKAEGEVAASEVSLAELALDARAHGKGVDRRLATLEVLRRELTVLPLDPEALHVLARLLPKIRSKELDLVPLLVASSAIAKGATHLLTDSRRSYPRELSPLKVVRF